MATGLYTRDGENAGKIYFDSYGHRTIRENPSYASPKKPTEYRLLEDSEYSAKELQRFPPRFDDNSPEAIAKLPEDRRQLTAEDLAQLQTYRDDIFFNPEELAIARKLKVFYPLTTQREQVIFYKDAVSGAYTHGGLQDYARLGEGGGSVKNIGTGLVYVPE